MLVRTDRPAVAAFAFALALSLAALGAGCGPAWTVVKASGPPSVLMGATAYAVAFDWSGLRVGGKSEAEYLSDKDEESKKNWEGDKATIKMEFMKELAASAKGMTISEASGSESAPDMVLVTVAVTHVEPGFYAGIAKRASTLTSRLRFAKGGDVVDEIEITTAQDADIYHPSSGQRLSNCAEALGGRAASFIASINKKK